MGFQLGNKPLGDQEANLELKEEVCFHYILEESSNPEYELKCSLCKTTWLQRLEDVVEQTINFYTNNYPCLVKCGHIVPYVYGKCPFCQSPKQEHLVKLVHKLATSLMESNVPEVKADL